ncbi:hypothetical protein Glove_19g316 [Diversispora epigaea]|uniref:Uncharacterized protein n=1 Tax=Diversispora epigaea TaxID=1348612 RepID=A0A397JL31_9GLOM|nr:hypothetical protein Glove_19g316 [Diversispora epigaea]
MCEKYAGHDKYDHADQSRSRFCGRTPFLPSIIQLDSGATCGHAKPGTECFGWLIKRRHNGLKDLQETEISTIEKFDFFLGSVRREKILEGSPGLTVFRDFVHKKKHVSSLTVFRDFVHKKKHTATIPSMRIPDPVNPSIPGESHRYYGNFHIKQVKFPSNNQSLHGLLRTPQNILTQIPILDSAYSKIFGSIEFILKRKLY